MKPEAWFWLGEFIAAVSMAALVVAWFFGWAGTPS